MGIGGRFTPENLIVINLAAFDGLAVENNGFDTYLNLLMRFEVSHVQGKTLASCVLTVYYFRSIYTERK